MYSPYTILTSRVEHLSVDDTRAVVIDEADTMFSYESYQGPVDKLIEELDQVRLQ